jgi:hypothetical protein
MSGGAQNLQKIKQVGKFWEVLNVEKFGDIWEN